MHVRVVQARVIYIQKMSNLCLIILQKSILQITNKMLELDSQLHCATTVAVLRVQRVTYFKLSVLQINTGDISLVPLIVPFPIHLNSLFNESQNPSVIIVSDGL